MVFNSKPASTSLGNETFAFDPAGNLIDPELLQNTEQHRDSQPINTRWDGAREEVKFDYRQLPKVMGNLLERYAGTHYQYDERGNRRRQTEPSGRTTEYIYDANDQLQEVKRYRRASAAGDTTPPDMHAKYGYDGFGRRLWKLVKDGRATPKLTVFSWDANLLTSEEVFEGEFHFWDTFAYPKEPELTPEEPSKRFSLPIAQRVHSSASIGCTNPTASSPRHSW